MSDLLNQASLVMVPSGYKEDTVYSVVPSDGSGDLAFTRASNGTRINSAGLVEVCPWNLLQQSETFENASWLKFDASATANATTAPNGTTTADKFVEGTGSSIHRFNQGLSIDSGQSYTFSVYAKASERTRILLRTNNGSADQDTYFDLTNGTIVSGTGTIESVGSGWYKISRSLTATTSVSSNFITQLLLVNTGTNTSYTGNGTSGVFIWGAQLNIGSTAKPYFPTTDRLNVPRLTYQNGGGGCPSLLLEPQRTNIFPNSQTTANWSFTNMSRTANYGISPDGTQNADLLSPTTSGSVTFQSDITTSSLVIGQPFVVSFFIKLNASFTSDAGTNILDIRLSGPTVWSRPTVRVNLETGEVTTINNAIYISSTNFGNGWFRITFGATPTGTSGQVALQLPTTVTMNGGSFYIWGLQGEANATYATSYIPSQASSATRVADLANVSQGAIANFGSNPFCVFLDVNFAKLSSTGAIALLGNRQTGAWWRIYSDGSFFYVEVNGSNGYRQIVFINSGTLTSRTKIAVNRNGNVITIYVNGSIATTETNISWSSDFTTGNSAVEFNSWGGLVYEITTTEYNEVVFFKQSLTATELASLTTI